jgi:parvulin-like peptidyl-prolyl isomerase
MGGMRQKIVNDLENSLVQVEARAQGLRDRADIVAKVDKSIEEMVVSKLYQETVKFDENVEFDELQVYYDANMERFQVPESRSGMLLIAENETAADAAYAALLAGDAWASVMERYNRDAGLKENGGRIDDIRSNARGPGRDALFALNLGEVGTPFAVGDGRFAVVRLDRIDPPRVRELTEVTEDIGNAIRQQRKEEAFQKLLAEWRSDLDIVVHEDRLEGLRSWQELKEAEAAALAAKVGIE